MDHAEKVAEAILQSVIPGGKMHYHADQSTGKHDFNLEYPDGMTSAVEVTISTDPNQEATVAEIMDKRKGGAAIKAILCQKDWYIHPVPNARIKRIRELADKYLYDIEADGLENFFGATDSNYYPSVDRISQDLGIDHGRVVRWKTPGYIRMATPGAGGFVMPENFQKAIETEAFKKDNRRKLIAAGTSERHLFVYVSSLNFLPWVTLIEGDMPTEPPQLPEEVTDVWAVTGAGKKGTYVVWKADKKTAWQSFGVVSIYE